jgi:hypothetical protein
MAQTMYAHMNKWKIKKRTPKTTIVGEDAGKKEPSHTAEGNVTYYMILEPFHRIMENMHVS